MFGGRRRNLTAGGEGKKGGQDGQDGKGGGERCLACSSCLARLSGQPPAVSGNVAGNPLGFAPEFGLASSEIFGGAGLGEKIVEGGWPCRSPCRRSGGMHPFVDSTMLREIGFLAGDDAAEEIAGLVADDDPRRSGREGRRFRRRTRRTRRTGRTGGVFVVRGHVAILACSGDGFNPGEMFAARRKIWRAFANNGRKECSPFAFWHIASLPGIWYGGIWIYMAKIRQIGRSKRPLAVKKWLWHGACFDRGWSLSRKESHGKSGRNVFWLVGEGGGQVGCVRQLKPCVHRIGGPGETANFTREVHVAGMRPVSGAHFLP